MNISKKRYIQFFCLIVILLGMVRCIFPSIADNTTQSAPTSTPPTISTDSVTVSDTVPAQVASTTQVPKNSKPSRFFKTDGTLVHNRILSVPHFGNTFPDQNDVQLFSAKKYGVSPVTDSHEAEQRKSELVYIGANPYFHTDRLRSSIPYLVPRASILLQDIGQAFFDSLQTKGVALHKLIVTSVLRSKNDVTRLRTHNANATQHSCHMYGTTFDIAYNRYKTVEAPGEHRREVRNDTLKWVLSEVLRDMRENQRCWIKYEVKQGCFHITVK